VVHHSVFNQFFHLKIERADDIVSERIRPLVDVRCPIVIPGKRRVWRGDYARAMPRRPVPGPRPPAAW
jgi:hypothetical protein